MPRKLNAIRLLVLFSFLQCSLAAVTHLETNVVPHRPDPAEVMSEWTQIGRTIARQSSPRGLRVHESTQRQVVLTNGTADDAFVITCYPEPGFNSSSYDIVFGSDNPLVLNESVDVTSSHVLGTEASNISVLVDFNRFPGTTTLTVEARRIADGSLYDSIDIHYIAAGLAIYQSDTDTILSGEGRSFVVDSYEEIYRKPHRDFSAFAQYLNGSDSSSDTGKSPPNVETFTVSDIKPAIHCTGQILWDQDFCSVVGGNWNGSATNLKRGCGMGFSIEHNEKERQLGLHYALEFQKHRAGRCVLVFDWINFTRGTIFDDEEYSNFLTVEISGQPPAVVRRIEPSNPFSSKGGEEIQVELINAADVNISSFNVHNSKFMLVNESRRFITDADNYYETVRFLTEPGSGKNLPWTISGTRLSVDNNSSEAASFLDETGFLFSYDDEVIELFDVRPSSLPESGGDIVTLVGNFGAFSIESAHHNILLGIVPIKKEHVLFASSSEIRFRAPSRIEIGNERSLRVKVQLEHSFSNAMNFTYLDLEIQLHGYTFGASYDLENETHVVGSCGNSSFMVMAENYDDSSASYKWRVSTSSSRNQSSLSLLNGIKALPYFNNINSLELPSTIFPEYGVPYSVVADVSIGNLSSTYTFLVQKSRNIVVGVTLIRPENRFLATPEVNLRILAKVDIPECFNEPTSLIYEWLYQEGGGELSEGGSNTTEKPGTISISRESSGRQFIFSSQNTTGVHDGTLTPLRLGRELIIPRQKLVSGTHIIHLTVRDRDQPRFFGRAITTATVVVSPLEAIIGSGFASRTVSDSEPLFLSGSASFDPNAFSDSDVDVELNFSWKCAFSFFSNFASASLCGSDLLSSETESEVIVPTSALQQKTSLLQGDNTKVYVRYSLVVRKGTRVGETSQTFIVTKTSGEKMAHNGNVDVLNSLGEKIDKTQVKFWEDIIIQPSAQTETLWSFRLDSPYDESARFLAGKENIISSPGYYVTVGSSAPPFQRLPLGIPADKLSPNQDYLFVIVFRKTGMLDEEVTVRLKTVEVPNLILPPLGRSSGTIDTLFRATATTSFNSNGTFTYQFYAMEVGNPDSEHCVDGCSGVNVVQFRIGKPGHYTFQCRLLSADGRKVLKVMNNPKTIVISSLPSPPTLDKMEQLMWKDYFLGDDGALIQRGFYVAELMNDEQAGDIIMWEEDRREICANVTSLWARLSRSIVANDLPSTARTRSYVRTAISCIRLRCVEREEVFYDILGLVDSAISRIPSEEALSTSSYEQLSDVADLGLEQDLLTFYNLSMTHALSTFVGGSSRDRLTAGQGAVGNIILDLGEMWTKHVTATATSGHVCGWEATYTSLVSKPLTETVTASTNQITPGINTMKVAVRCTREEGTALTTPYASFRWCDAVYDLTGRERKLITLAETFDFPFFSRIQGENKTDSARLVSVGISTLGANNKLVTALSESMVAAQAQESGEELKSCYQIGLKMKSGKDVRTDKGAYNIPYVMRPRKAFGQTLMEPFEGGYYGRRTKGIIVTPGSRNRTDFAIARSNTLGLYGVEKANDRSAFDRLRDTLEGTGFALIGILIGIIILILIIAILLFSVVSFILSMQEPPALETTEAYVDRDFYGRRDVRLQVGTTDSASVATTAESTQSAASGRNRNGGMDDEDMLGTTIRHEGGENAPR